MSVYEPVFAFISMQNSERSLNESQRETWNYAEEDEATDDNDRCYFAMGSTALIQLKSGT